MPSFGEGFADSFFRAKKTKLDRLEREKLQKVQIDLLKAKQAEKEATLQFAEKALGLNPDQINNVGSMIDTGLGIGNAATEGFCGELTVNRPSSTALHTRAYGNGTYSEGAGLAVMVTFGGSTQDNSAMNGIQFLMGSGNIASGVIRMYGIKDA